MGTTIDSSNTSALASTLFDKLDTKKKGYIDQADLQAAAPNAKDDNSAAVFKALDTDGDGKVSKSELSTAIDKVGEQLNAQRDASRVDAAAADAGGGAAAANAAVAASGGARAGGAHHGGGHGGGGHGGRHEGAAPAAGASGGASPTTTATKYVAAADANNDGTVSDAEEAAYEQTQAAAALKAAEAKAAELKAQGQVETYKAVGCAGEATQATAAVDVTA